MSPSVTALLSQSQIARLPVLMMRTLFNMDTVPFIKVIRRVSLWKVAV